MAEYGYMGAFVINGKGIVAVATIEESVGRDLSKKDYFIACYGRENVCNEYHCHLKYALINEFDEKEIGLPTMIVYNAPNERGWRYNRCCRIEGPRGHHEQHDA